VIVTGADPARPHGTSGSRSSELALRVASALVLVPLAIATAYWGGWPFAVFWGAAAVGVFWEWTALVTGADRRSVLLVGGASVALSLLLVVAGYRLAAALVLVIGTLGAGALAPAGRRGWAAAGVPYAGALAIAPVVLRSDRDDGFLAIILLFAIVWATDIIAYFAGRAIGGPKLMPLVSPKKTWSGAICGTVAALVVALAVAKIASSFAGGASTGWLAIAVLAVILSVITQAGDLFESFLKRRFGAKDSSHLIPGHGGLMDRLDGFVTASAVAALIGLLRGGFEAPGRGLLVW
jgi:phosphatidate cytidylyltransferase